MTERKKDFYNEVALELDTLLKKNAKILEEGGDKLEYQFNCNYIAGIQHVMNILKTYKVTISPSP